MRKPEIKNAMAGTIATFNIAGISKRNTTSHLTMPDPGIFKKVEESKTTTNIQLRDYQQECLSKIQDRFNCGIKRQLITLPTGAGKTCVFATLIGITRYKTLIIAHTCELLTQAKEKIEMICPSLKVGLVNAYKKEFAFPVVVSSIQSARQPDNLAQLQQQGFEMLVYDESHHISSPSGRLVIESLGFGKGTDKLLVGFTATNQRSDHRGLGEDFDEIVFTKTVKNLVNEGYLSKPIGIKIKTDLDLSTVKTENGDFVTQSLASVMDTQEMNELVVNTFLERAPNRKALCFSVTVCHAQHLAEAFRNRGIASEAVHGDMSASERSDLLGRFKSGSISVLTNCQILTEGYDEPSIDCILVAKPTQSKGLYQQMCGRGLRLFPNKTDCLILDFGSKSHSLCSVAALTNDAESEEAEQQEKAEGKMSEFAKGLPASINRKLRAAIIEFDLLGDTFQWQKDGAAGFTLPGGGRKYLKIFKTAAEDKYDVVFFNGNESKTISKGLNFAYSFATAEDFAKNKNNRSHFIVSDLNASWRNDPISENQKKCFRSCGYKNGIEDMTKGQASIIIASGILQRKIRNKY